MIIKHKGPGVVPDPYRVKAVDGPPPVGAILSNASCPNDIRLEVVSVDWTYNYGFFGCRLEAVVLVKRLPTQAELAEDALWEGK